MGDWKCKKGSFTNHCTVFSITTLEQINFCFPWWQFKTPDHQINFLVNFINWWDFELNLKHNPQKKSNVQANIDILLALFIIPKTRHSCYTVEHHNRLEHPGLNEHYHLTFRINQIESCGNTTYLSNPSNFAYETCVGNILKSLLYLDIPLPSFSSFLCHPSLTTIAFSPSLSHSFHCFYLLWLTKWGQHQC